MRTLLLIGVLCCLPTAARAGTILWYNGDSRPGGNATINFESTNLGSSNIYDDFIVDQPWTINRVWSNNSMNVTGITQASWAIRKGVSDGDGGTLVAGGIGTATQTLTGRPGNPHANEYTIEVAGLNVLLTPDTYWLSVSPVVGNAGSGVLASYNSSTMKDNAIGGPSTNNINSYHFWPAAGNNYEAHFLDFSMGVAGTAVPEPSTFALLGLGALGIGIGRRRREAIEQPQES